jgi:GNAT superfamily N-acetyltransferase
VAAPLTFSLRQAVLRPHQTPQELALPGDDDPASAHFAAFDTQGAVIATASVRRETPHWHPTERRGWRLRGMATEARWRNRGLGAALVVEVIGHVSAEGGGLLWCHARTPALEFYRRSGFVTWGEPWIEPQIGPHVVMWRLVD